MKKLIYIVLCVLCAKGVAFGQGIYRIDHPGLQQENGMLLISFEMVIPGSAVGSAQSLFLYPVLHGDAKELELPPLAIHGKNRSRSLRRMAALRKEEGKENPPLYEIEVRKNSSYPLRYSLEIPYESWMDEKTTLSLQEEIRGCGQTSRKASYQKVAQIQREEKESFTLQPFVAFAVPAITVKEREEEGSAYLDFPTGGSTILPDYRRNPEELRKIRQSLEKTRRDPDTEITGIAITGYASPESNYEFNQRLSAARAGALKNYIRRMSGLPEHLFQVRAGGEDWNKLRELIEESYLPNQSQVLSIIDNHEGYDRKEEQLKALGYTYQHLLQEYFPLLRRVHYQIRYTIREYSEGEYRSVMEKDPGKLSPYELYRLSENYEPDTEAWKEILLLSARLYPEDEISQVNAAAIRLMEKDFEGAKVYLDRLTYSTLPEAWNNRGVYLLHTGDYTGARELFLRAVEKGLEEAKENLERLFQK